MTVIDVAGGPMGGAARWRREAQKWVAARELRDVLLVGEARRLDAHWIVRREAIGKRQRRVAANNLSFVSGRGPRVVLLRDALHFLRDGEARTLPGLPSGLLAESRLVRLAAHRADVVVVPCGEMRERVVNAMPRLEPRVSVRFHPLSVETSRKRNDEQPYIVMPMPWAVHKPLEESLRALLDAVQAARIRCVVKITARPADIGFLSRHPAVEAIGPQPLEAMSGLIAGATAIYAPTRVESFGYPVAEARAYGVPVLGLETSRNLEVGASALVTFDPRKPSSLAEALLSLADRRILGEPGPFDPDAYFSWLVSL